MTEPQVPGVLQGLPAEGTGEQPGWNANSGYQQGVTPNLAPYAPSGNPAVNTTITRQTKQGESAQRRSWNW